MFSNPVICNVATASGTQAPCRGAPNFAAKHELTKPIGFSADQPVQQSEPAPFIEHGTIWQLLREATPTGWNTKPPRPTTAHTSIYKRPHDVKAV